MPDSLARLEQQRAALARQVAQLDDFRPGSITATSGRCGKPNCHGHPPGQPVHGPHLRLTFKVDGKTVSESLPHPAAVRKAERETAEFRKFQQLSQEFVGGNARICRLRPVEAEPEAPTAQEKKRPKPSAKKSRAR